MLGERSDQRGLWEADQLYLDLVGRDTFYGLLASLRGWLFRDADFAEFYCPDNGRASGAPSLLATALLLQAHDTVSDIAAKPRAQRRNCTACDATGTDASELHRESRLSSQRGRKTTRPPAAPAPTPGLAPSGGQVELAAFRAFEGAPWSLPARRCCSSGAECRACP